MNKHDNHHQRFQIDRIALFSDAVFAIAITLLIIEIKIPEIEAPYTDKHLLEELNHLIGKFIGLFISFMVIGRYWIFHHRLFGYVTNYNSKLLWANLWFMFSIVLMPFTSGFYSQYWSSYMFLPLLLYVINICFTGFLNARLLTLVSNPLYNLSDGLENTQKVTFYKVRSLIAPGTFLISLFIAVFNIPLAYYSPMLIPLVSLIVNRYYRKRHPEFFEK